LGSYLKTAGYVLLSGLAEPLMYDRILDVVRRCKQLNKDAMVGFNMNGVLLSAETDRRLIESGLDLIHVSVNGLNPLGHSKGTPILFKLVMEKVKELSEVKRSLGSSNPEISFCFVAMIDNLHELPTLLELSKDVGCSTTIWTRIPRICKSERIN
jgi:MoaA/NifB/PqqE/SkfB family radical SAM enzyme